MILTCNWASAAAASAADLGPLDILRNVRKL